MPFFGNILPTLRSYSGIEYPPGQRLRLHFAFAAERPGSGLRADAATSRVLTRDRRQGRRAAGGGQRRGPSGRRGEPDQPMRAGGHQAQGSGEVSEETAKAGAGQNSQTHVSLGDAGRRLSAGVLGTFGNPIRLARGSVRRCPHVDFR